MAQEVLPLPDSFPGNRIPVIFAEVALSFVPGLIVKFYLGRGDPGLGPNLHVKTLPTAVAQIIMPAGSFGHMYVFFEEQMKRMLQSKFVTEEMLDGFRKELAATREAEQSAAAAKATEAT